MKNDYNESSGKIPKYEKLTKQNFEIFSGFGQKMAWKFQFGLASHVPAEPAHFCFCLELCFA